MIEQLNIELFNLINQYAGVNPLVDTLAVFVAQYMPIVLTLGLIYLWIVKEKSTRNIILYAVYAAIIGLAINMIIGMFYFHPRPFMIPIGTVLFQYPAESSFPSDHTTMMVSLSLMLIYFKETRNIGLVFLGLSLIGGFARIFSGVHFPLDILGSVVVSIFSTLLIYSMKERLDPLNSIIQNIYSKLVNIKKGSGGSVKASPRKK